MSNIEGNNPPSVSLRDFMDEKFAQHQREHVQHEEAHKREHKDSQKAIDTAAALQKETKKDANEWRGAMDDREKTLATKVDIQTLTDSVNELKDAEIKRAEREAVKLVQENNAKLAAKDAQSASQWKIALMVGALATLGSVMVTIILNFI